MSRFNLSIAVPMQADSTTERSFSISFRMLPKIAGLALLAAFGYKADAKHTGEHLALKPFKSHDSSSVQNCTAYYDYLKRNPVAAAILNGADPDDWTEIAPCNSANLNLQNLNDTNAVALAPALLQLQDVNSLTINGTLDFDAMSSLFTSIKQMPLIQLEADGLTLGGFIALSGAISNMSSMSTLSIEPNLGSIGAAVLESVLLTMVSLQHLYLDNNDFGDSNVVTFAPALEEMLVLQRLSLSNNNIGDFGVVTLVPVFKKMLSTPDPFICLSSNQYISDVGADMFLTILRQTNYTQPATINLNNIPITSAKQAEMKKEFPNIFWGF